MGRKRSLPLSIAYILIAALSFLDIRTYLSIQGLSSIVSFVIPLSLSLPYVTQANPSSILLASLYSSPCRPNPHEALK
jgi:hypothetical protein